MDFLLDIIKEYFLIAKNHLLFFIVKKPPSYWENGQKGKIILIPGFFGIWHDMKTLGDRLNRQGYQIITIDLLEWNLHSIYRGSDEFKKFLTDNDLRDIIAVGHSKGGLVVRKAIEDPNCLKRFKRIFTVCTPHHGTIYAHLRILFLDELIPNGRLMKDLQKHSENNSRIINIVPKFDNHIMPNKNAYLEQSQNIEIPVIGHTRILETKQLADTILSHI